VVLNAKRGTEAPRQCLDLKAIEARLAAK
jgi:hypothetical protein